MTRVPRHTASVMKLDLALMFGSLIGATLVAELLGANNTAIALGVGQIAFLIATTYVIVRPRPSR